MYICIAVDEVEAWRQPDGLSRASGVCAVPGCLVSSGAFPLAACSSMCITSITISMINVTMSIITIGSTNITSMILTMIDSITSISVVLRCGFGCFNSLSAAETGRRLDWSRSGAWLYLLLELEL